MDFFLRLDSTELNLVFKGLEVLREGASTLHAQIVAQVSAQSQAHSSPPASPDASSGPVATDTAPISPEPVSDTSSAPAA